MKLYCSECGMLLKIIRKPLQKYGIIIDCVVPHICLDEVVEIDLNLKPIDLTPSDSKGKFVKSLNELGARSILGSVSTGELRDRRYEVEKEKIPAKSNTTAPSNIKDMISKMANSLPVHTLEEPESEE